MPVSYSTWKRDLMRPSLCFSYGPGFPQISFWPRSLHSLSQWMVLPAVTQGQKPGVSFILPWSSEQPSQTVPPCISCIHQLSFTSLPPPSWLRSCLLTVFLASNLVLPNWLLFSSPKANLPKAILPKSLLPKDQFPQRPVYLNLSILESFQIHLTLLFLAFYSFPRFFKPNHVRIFDLILYF